MENDVNVSMKKKDAIVERLDKRRKDRQNYLETKYELRNKSTTEMEGADYFAREFSERAKSIEKNLINIQPENVDLLRVFTGINSNIQELQRYLTNSTLFLPDYNIKACQNILNELTTRSEVIRQKFLPKKKFGFNNKKIPKAVLQSGVDKTDFVKKVKSVSSFIWTLSDRNNEYILLVGTDVDHKDITISNMRNCFVEIRGHAGSVQIESAINCTFLCGPISRSLFAENCINCNIIAACQQLRLHGSSNCKLWLHVTCRAIVEDCKGVEVGDYNYEYAGIDIDYKKSGLDENINNFRDIADFNWLSPEKPSPNWKLMCDTDYERPDWNELKNIFINNKNNL